MSHAKKRLRTLAARVMDQGGSPLTAEERSALYKRMAAKPMYLLGSTTAFARGFIRKAAGRFDVRGVVDDFSRESEVEGVPRVGSGEFTEAGSGAMAVCLAFSHAGKEYFERLCRVGGVELVHYMEAVDSIADYPRDHILDALARSTAVNIEPLLAASEQWADAISRHTYHSILNGRLTYDRTWLESVDAGPETMYFGMDPIKLGPRETLVDCGAFDGDTIENFRASTADAFEGIVALEPDPHNFAMLSQRYGGDRRIRLHPLAASSMAGDISFVPGLGPLSFSEEPGRSRVTVAAAPLDTLLDSPATLIKIDVEGGESEVLEGAQHTIETCRPRLTIAAYHRPLDMMELPRWIESVAPGYRFYLRHHGGFFLETVLYAIPEEVDYFQ